MLYERNPEVYYETLEDETILLHPAEEIYYSLNATGTLLWENLPGELHSLIQVLYQQFEDSSPASAKEDVKTSMDELKSHGLVLEQKI